MDPVEEIETILLRLPEVKMFNIPPRKSASEMKCTGWEQFFMWKGPCHVVAKGETLKVVFLEADKVFAQAPMDMERLDISLEKVIDSSRFFVVTLQDPASGKHKTVGIGFDERTHAFQFRASIYDFAHHLEIEEEVSNAPPVDLGDLSFRRGEKISLEIPSPSHDSLQQKKSPRSRLSGNSPFSLRNSPLVTGHGHKHSPLHTSLRGPTSPRKHSLMSHPSPPTHTHSPNKTENPKPAHNPNFKPGSLLNKPVPSQNSSEGGLASLFGSHPDDPFAKFSPDVSPANSISGASNTTDQPSAAQSDPFANLTFSAAPTTTASQNPQNPPTQTQPATTTPSNWVSFT